MLRSWYQLMRLGIIKGRVRDWLTRLVEVGAEFVHLDHQRFADRHLGILQYQTPQMSGEAYFIGNVLPDLLTTSGGAPNIVDAGANEGGYTALVLGALNDCRVHCFEPNPPTFVRLAARHGNNARVKLNRLAVGEVPSTAEIFDYAGRDGSTHASLYADVLTTQHRAEAIESSIITVVRLDDYVSENDIDDILLLKLDLEGHELAALKGVREVIRSKRVSVVHFEFNEMNVISRTFMRDFYAELSEYSFFRLRKDGLIPLGSYSAKLEVFQYQNIVAIRKDINHDAVSRHVVKSIW